MPEAIGAEQPLRGEHFRSLHPHEVPPPREDLAQRRDDSEIVVRSPHSCQANPATVAEVRRILLLHLAAP